jgi:hypothetical protein
LRNVLQATLGDIETRDISDLDAVAGYFAADGRPPANNAGTNLLKPMTEVSEGPRKSSISGYTRSMRSELRATARK